MFNLHIIIYFAVHYVLPVIVQNRKLTDQYIAGVKDVIFHLQTEYPMLASVNYQVPGRRFIGLHFYCLSVISIRVYVSLKWHILHHHQVVYFLQ